MVKGAVVCPQPLAAEAAIEVLAGGGNAVDAVVAAAAVQGVIDPGMCGLGGYGVMTIHSAATGKSTTIDFFGRAPLSAEEGMFADQLVGETKLDYGFVLEGGANLIGPRSIATPGTVAGMAYATEHYGTLPWRSVLEPAATIARDGYVVTKYNYDAWSSPDGPDKAGSKKKLSYSESGRALYLKDDEVVPVGSVVRNVDYASTLERLMQAGAADFYRGEIAAAIVEDLRAGGSMLELRDFEQFIAEEKAPLTGTYRGLGYAVPSIPAGGISMIQALNMLELLLPEGNSEWISTDTIEKTARALLSAIQDKYRFLAGSRDEEIPIEEMISKEFARKRLAGMDNADAGENTNYESESTTHISVVDGDGNAAAMTHTLASGSGVITPGLGFMYNNFMHGYDPRPGRWNSLRPGATRPASMAPGVLFDPSGAVRGVFGASGSTRIVTTLVQVISHLVDRGMDPVAAINAPRLNVQRTGLAQFEGRFPRSVLRELEQAGTPVELYPRNYDTYFGKAHVLYRKSVDDEWQGAVDPRGDGGMPMFLR